MTKEDAELIHMKYKNKLHVLEENEKSVNEQLQTRLNELDTEARNIKSMFFDAKLQYKSNEMIEEAYQQISMYTNELVEHINLEKAEISNVKTRLSQQTLENVALTTQSSTIREPSNVPESDSQPQQESSIQNISMQQQSSNDTQSEEKVYLTNEING